MRRPDAVEIYVAKEGAKAAQKKIPSHMRSVGRMWGTSRNFRNYEPIEIVYDLEEAEARAVLAEAHAARRAAWARVGIDASMPGGWYAQGCRIVDGSGGPDPYDDAVADGLIAP